jgi:hypothetical protein
MPSEASMRASCQSATRDASLSTSLRDGSAAAGSDASAHSTSRAESFFTVSNSIDKTGARVRVSFGVAALATY